MEGRARLFNILTLGVLGMTVVVIGIYVLIAVNPRTPLNPFPPPTPLARPALRSETFSSEGRTTLPTWMLTLTPPAMFIYSTTPTPTLRPTALPTRTPYPTDTPHATRSPTRFTYKLTYKTPYYGCNWAGVAGLVEDLEGHPLPGYSVHIWGRSLDVVVTSGEDPMYGESGWEQMFGNVPIEVEGTYKVQLHDHEPPHTPVSEVVALEFQGQCAESLAFIVFVKNH